MVPNHDTPPHIARRLEVDASTFPAPGGSQESAPAEAGLAMTYMHEGRQYIVVSVGGGGEPAELVALALPRDGSQP